MILVRKGGVSIGFSSGRAPLSKVSGRSTSQEPARGEKEVAQYVRGGVIK